jgi:hypothetical protein
MFRNSKLVVTLCSIALSVVAAPLARAQSGNQPQPIVAFQSGPGQIDRVASGDGAEAQRCAALFNNAYHVGYNDGAWVIWGADGKQQVVVCYPKDVSYDAATGVLSIAGTFGNGPFAGATLTGKLTLRGDGIAASLRVAKGGTGGGGGGGFFPPGGGGSGGQGFDVSFQCTLQLVWVAEDA